MTSSSAQTTARPPSIPWNLLGPGLITAAFGFMTWISWRRWPDVIIDYGQQLYVPWVLSEGQVLYRDVVYFHGPLASYLHAFLFKLFGPGMMHLALLNLALVFAFALFLFHWVRQISSASTATLAGLAFVLAFAFAYYWGMGLLNFIGPYVYDLTYGFMLGCVTLYQLYRYTLDPRAGRLSLIGFLLGLVFLTKAEMFVATAAAVVTGLLVDARHRPEPLRVLALRLILVAAWAFLPVFLFALYFSLKMPIGDAVFHLFSQWIHGLNPEIRGLFYYKFVSGTLFWERNLAKIGVHLLVYTAVVGLLIAADRAMTQRGVNTPRAGLYVALILGATLVLLYNTVPWRHLTRSFPVMLMMVCGLLLFQCTRKGRGPFCNREDLSLLTLSVFGLVLTLKAFLNLNISHLGFILALPATLVVIILLVDLIPRHLESRYGSAWTFRCGAWSLAAVTVMIWASMNYTLYQYRTYPVGRGADMIYTFPPDAVRFDGTPLNHARVVEEALAFMEREIDPDETLLTLPDAMMFNYLVRRKYPTRDTLLNPLVSIIRGDDAVIRLLEKNPPDYVLFVDADFSMFGGPVFGKEFAQKVKAWIDARYMPVRRFGATPFSGEGFGALLLRKDESGPAGVTSPANS